MRNYSRLANNIFLESLINIYVPVKTGYLNALCKNTVSAFNDFQRFISKIFASDIQFSSEILRRLIRICKYFQIDQIAFLGLNHDCNFCVIITFFTQCFPAVNIQNVNLRHIVLFQNTYKINMKLPVCPNRCCTLGALS